MKAFIIALSIFICGTVFAATEYDRIAWTDEEQALFLQWCPNTETWDDDADEDTPEVKKYTDTQHRRGKLKSMVNKWLGQPKQATHVSNAMDSYVAPDVTVEVGR